MEDASPRFELEMLTLMQRFLGSDIYISGTELYHVSEKQ